MLQKASVLISKTSKRTRDSVSKKAPFLGLVAFPPGFEPGAFRLGVETRAYRGILHSTMYYCQTRINTGFSDTFILLEDGVVPLYIIGSCHIS